MTLAGPPKDWLACLGWHTRCIVPSMAYQPHYDHADRVTRAGNLIADAAEGKLTGQDSWIAWNMIVGWLDICDATHAREYKALASQLESILRSAE